MSCQNDPTKSTFLFGSAIQTYFNHIAQYARYSCVFFIPYVAYKYGLWTSDPLNYRLAIMTSYEVLKVIRWVTFSLFIIFFIMHLLSLFFATEQLRNNAKIKIWDSYRKAIVIFPSFAVFIVHYCVRVMMWGLLLIVPGIIKMVEYSLAFAFFLIEGSKINESFKLSEQAVRPVRFKFWIGCIFTGSFVLSMSYAVIIFFEAIIFLLVGENLVWIAVILDVIQSFILLNLFILPIVFLNRAHLLIRDRHLCP